MSPMRTDAKPHSPAPKINDPRPEPLEHENQQQKPHRPNKHCHETNIRHPKPPFTTSDRLSARIIPKHQPETLTAKKTATVPHEHPQRPLGHDPQPVRP